MASHAKIAKFERLAKDMLTLPDIARGHGKGGFGENALTVRGKIFAMITSHNHFSVKLPRDRVATLVESGDGTHLVMANRQMKEWLVVSDRSKLDWKSVANEAYLFVADGA